MAADENGFLSRHFRDDDMHDRIIRVVQKALNDADPSRVFSNTVGGYERTYCPFALHHDPDMFAARQNVHGGVAYELEFRVFRDEKEDVNARTCLAAVARPERLHLENVSWQWGESAKSSPDEAAAAEYLAWWERIVDASPTAAANAVPKRYPS